MDENIAAPGGFTPELADILAVTWAARRSEIEKTCTPVRQWMLRELGAAQGDTILELAAGVGDTGFAVSTIVGETGSLITTDSSPAMLSEAQRRGAELDVSNVEYRVIDAERIGLEADSVDGVICRFGYMLMPHPDAALSETRRVLRHGGRVVLAVWGEPQRNLFFTGVGTSLVTHDRIPPPPPPPAPGIFAMASTDRTTSLLAAAGFADIRTDEVALQFSVASVDAYLDFVADTAGPLAFAVRGLEPAERAEVHADIEAAFAQFATDAGYEIPGVALCAVAT